MRENRRLPVGAELLVGGGVHFRVWAPRRREVEVVVEGGPGTHGAGQRVAQRLEAEGGGYFSGLVSSARAGTRYRYRLDGAESYPDPAARFQPEGPHGPSQVIDPGPFPWADRHWQGIGGDQAVLYEMHIGTFTRAGTWEAAGRELAELAGLGITLVEVMPVADFPGRFGWGYDGVNLFAPTRLYGVPDDFRRFIDRAHAVGLGVILDVVYNHIGPDGNYLKQFSEDYFTDRYKNEWGEALNFDGDNAGPVREFFVANAGYWIEEFHVDGLRLDATQQIFDESSEHVLAELARHTRQAGGWRAIYLVAENETQHAELVRPPEEGGHGLDAVWNDDFHHSAMVVLSGRSESYYSDFRGTPQEFISAAKYGFLYQGQRSTWQKKRRGTPTFGLPPSAFVTFIQNHDQVSNLLRGERCHQLTSPGRYRAMTALLLLGPQTPLLFQGQEFAATSPFVFFADHDPDLAKLVRKGRGEFLRQFPSIATPEAFACLPDPGDPATFERCKLDLSERASHGETYTLHRDLLRLRREDPVLRERRPGGCDGAVLGDEAFCLRFFGGDKGDRLLVVNFGADLRLGVVPEPLLAPPADGSWQMLWSSEDVRYGGCGTAPLDTELSWLLPGETAVLLGPGPTPAERDEA